MTCTNWHREWVIKRELKFYVSNSWTVINQLSLRSVVFLDLNLLLEMGYLLMLTLAWWTEKHNSQFWFLLFSLSQVFWDVYHWPSPKLLYLWSFPGGTSGKDPACQRRRHKRHEFNPGVGRIPWRRAWQPTPVFLPGESHGQRGLVGYSPWGCKQLDMT